MTCEMAKSVSLPTFLSFKLMVVKLSAKEIEKFSIVLYGKIHWWLLSLMEEFVKFKQQ